MICGSVTGPVMSSILALPWHTRTPHSAHQARPPLPHAFAPAAPPGTAFPGPHYSALQMGLQGCLLEASFLLMSTAEAAMPSSEESYLDSQGIPII